MAKSEKSVPEEKQATEFLANERTFLAWIRTSVALISLGFVVSKFHSWFPQNTGSGGEHGMPGPSLKVGMGMAALGGIIVVMAAWRYHSVNKAIELGKVTADRWLILLITSFMIILVVAMIAVMISTAHQP